MITWLVTGSRGKIGSVIFNYYKSKGIHLLEFDINANVSHDATSEENVKTFFNDSTKINIEVIINCIGIPDAVPLKSIDILDIDTKYFNRMIDINLNSVFLIIKECYRHNKHSLKTIINIASMYSVISPRSDLYNGYIKNPAYTASKHGLIGLTKHLAELLSKDCITVNCISPGGVTETISDGLFLSVYIPNVPLKTTIPIQEIINTIDYLTTMKTITGQNIIIDGGYSII